MYLDRFIKRTELVEFEKMLQTSSEGNNVRWNHHYLTIEHAVVEHNLLAASKLFTILRRWPRWSFEKSPPEKAERVASR